MTGVQTCALPIPGISTTAAADVEEAPESSTDGDSGGASAAGESLRSHMPAVLPSLASSPPCLLSDVSVHLSLLGSALLCSRWLG